MNNQTVLIEAEQFFAPMPSDLVDSLISEHRVMKEKLHEMHSVIIGNNQTSIIDVFMRGNKKGADKIYSDIRDIFNIDGAIAQLNADFWQKTILLTDVYDHMPAERRNEWNDQIREMTTPDFTEDTVRNTLSLLLNSRQQFFSERVDGIFRALSGEHVTNQPQGFGKRMIISRVFNEYGSVCYRTAGYISDLRQIIAKFMGRDEPNYSLTEAALYSTRRNSGEWVSFDGGALRIRTYMKGTAHLEVHPEMAWRLNGILAHLYPSAIPAEFRQKPKRKLKDFVMMEHPLPFAVLYLLSQTETMKHFEYRPNKWDEVRQPLTTNPNNLRLKQMDVDKAVLAQAERVLSSLGGVKIKHNSGINFWEFDFCPKAVINEIITSGCIPDQQSHQYYPTPESLAKMAVELADINEFNKCLEPSAGQGNIAQFMPVDRTMCVEISKLHCTVLESKGFNVEHCDFIKFAENTFMKFDRVVMNPPFSEGRAKFHTIAAADLLKPGGKLVAILPSGFKNKKILDGFNEEWLGPFDNEFAGTGISVVILKATKLEINNETHRMDV